MKGIKIVGGVIFILSIVLILYASFIAEQNRIYQARVVFISEQKAFTQEISKSIFYLYRNRKQDDTHLNSIVKKYLDNLSSNEGAFTQSREIVTLWNRFYADVQRFRDQQEVQTGYDSLLMPKLVNRIYQNNLLLVEQFEQRLKEEQASHNEMMRRYHGLQYGLFMVLLGLLLYLFGRVHWVMEFIQQFTQRSKKILENTTIRGLKPITLKADNALVSTATENHNQLVEEINLALKQSRLSLSRSTHSLEQLAQRIEAYMELIAQMQKSDVDAEEIFRREDTVIDALETLMRLRRQLNQLEKKLEHLIHASVNSQL